MGSKKGRKIPNMILRDMRHVYRSPKEKDQPRHAPLRRQFEEKPGEFLAGLRQAEKDHRAAQPKTPPGGVVEAVAVVVKDEGTERVVDLIDRLLTEAGAPDRGNEMSGAIAG